MPWDEYLAMDEQLEIEEPTRASDTSPYNHDKNDESEQEQEEYIPPVKHDDALNYLQQIQKSNLGDAKLFDILEQAMNLVQYKKTVTELTSKTKQFCIKKFFNS